jgi:imidazolonepropionase-like amidohydrolase
MRARLLALSACVALASSAFAQSVIPNNPGTKATFAIRNATIHPVSSAPIPNGTIVFSGGLIRAIGRDVAAPSDATVIDGTGLSVYPGLIDSGTAIGLTEISSVAGSNDVNELGDLNSNARAAVAINPHSNLIPVARVNGITAVVTAPGGGLISGQAALIQLAGWTPEEMVLKDPVGMVINFPRIRTSSFFDLPQDEEAEKEAKKAYGKQLDKLRDVIRDARAYGKAWDARGRATTTPRFDRDLILETMVPVVQGRLPLIVQANLEEDIRAAIRFAQEVDLKMILAGGADVQKVLDELKRRDIPVLLGPIWQVPPREDDPYDLIYTNAAALHQAGVRFAIQTSDAHDVRNLPYQAASAAAFGLPREVALRAITIQPAEILGVADRIGSLEVGKMANLFVTDGDPLEIMTQVKHLFIAGEPISLETNQTLLYDKFRNRP